MSFQTKRVRTKVYCYCKKCNGSLVDPRTEKKTYIKRINYEEPRTSDEIDDIEMDFNEIDDNAMEHDPPVTERDYNFLTKKLSINESEKSLIIKKGKISDQVIENLLLDADDNDKDSDDRDPDEDSKDDEENDDYEEINFASPDFDTNELKLPPNLDNDTYIWIILWVLQYQQRYKLSTIAIDSLFKFLRFTLSTIDASKFSSFPSSLYMAKKKLGIPTEVIQYAACNKCHKLYDINELDKTEVQTCSFINYPNHTMERFRQECNNLLTKKINNNNEQILRPIMTYPLVNIRQQLTLFFSRKDFEMSCQKWSERKNDTEALFDIYDGRIWKEFTDDDNELFFTKENADTRIGLIINMDWFQPFVSSLYSVGVIYAVI